MNKEVVIIFILAAARCTLSSLLCSQGLRKPVPGNCSAYLECMNQRWEVRQCNHSRFSFDADVGTCRPGWLVNCQNAPRNCSKPGEKMEVPGDCGSYYKCLQDGQVVKESCSIFERFDTSSSACLLWFKVDCNDHMECSTNIKFPILGNNKKYKNCYGGRFVTNSCTAGKLFNQEKNECIDSPTSNIKESEVSICKEGSLKPVPGTCNEYYKCTGGKFQKNKCWWFQRFSSISLSCELYWDVTCTQDSQCKSGDSAPMNNCSEYYKCENGKWEKKNCGSEIGLQMYFDAPSKECLVYNASCFKGECAVEGLKTPFPGDCSKYRVCRKGQYYIEKCGWLQKFDSDSQACQYLGVDCTSEQDMTVCTNGRRESVDGSCYAFKECVQGQFETKYCFFPLYRYDRGSSSCQFMASCDKQCFSGETRSVPGRCDQYYICKDGKYVVQTCLRGFYYDVVTSTCTEPTQATCDSASTLRSRRKRDLSCYYPLKLIDPFDCGKYVECVGNQWKRQECGYFQKFDPSSGSCKLATSCFMSSQHPTEDVPFHLITRNPVITTELPITSKGTPATTPNLIETTATSVSVPTKDPPNTSVHSPTSSSGCITGRTKPITGSCKDYLLCDKNGKWLPQTCSTWCKNFDPNSSKCVWRWKYPCSSNTAECKEDTKKADSQDCKKYYLCVSGKYQSRSCSLFHKFNKNKRDCQFSFYPWC